MKQSYYRVFISVVLGFVITLCVYSLTIAITSEEQPNNIDCVACKHDVLLQSNKMLVFKEMRVAGFPLKSRARSDVVSSGDAAAAQFPLNAYVDLFMSWQFFVNWFIWSAVVYGLWHVIRKTNAHPRH